jgi:threonine dehydrogenase-like Zn-dependent dehydrogenase
MTSTEQSWPEFAAAARASGVQATLSIPLVIDSVASDGTTELVGSVNVYSRSTPRFEPIDEKVLSLYTSQASRAISTNRQWRRLRDKVAQLTEALVSRTDIDQAKGALRVLNGGSADEAFAVLVERSQRENVKVRDLARHIVEDLSRGLPPH